MACLYDTTVKNCGPGDHMLVEKIGWCIKIETDHRLIVENGDVKTEELKNITYNVVVEHGWRLIYLPPETEVVSGYGWGER